MRCTRITWMGTRLSRVGTRFMALRIADLYYVILLMWNESFRNLAGEVKAFLLSYCAKNHMDEQIREVGLRVSCSE